MHDRREAIEVAEQRDHLSTAGAELFAGDFLAALAPGLFDHVLCSAVTNMFDIPVSAELRPWSLRSSRSTVA
jgi:hypothetical protein